MRNRVNGAAQVPSLTLDDPLTGDEKGVNSAYTPGVHGDPQTRSSSRHTACRSQHYRNRGDRLRQCLHRGNAKNASCTCFPLPPVLNLAPADFLIELSDHYLFAVLHEILYVSLMAENRRCVQHLEGAVKHLVEESDKLRRQSNARPRQRSLKK